MALTEHQRQEIAALKTMMDTDGWRVFIREMTNDREILNKNALAQIDSENKLYYYKGVDEILNRVINYDKIVASNEFTGEE
jgi:IS1 family transposase